ncbi:MULTISPECIES: S1 family peptidase [unclassified Kribbella]|uniref:S1 family peptidase n=1 Tax=unclassified Kribbella TaxID=2644121 RepID=UPI0030180559
MEDGRQLPRPPRRVPAGAATLTQLQTSTPRPPEPPPRQPWIFGRFLAGFVVFLLIVAAGATAGWFLRDQNLRIDTEQVLDSTGHAVVRVLATTCAGTGEASGVLTDGGRILTAGSAVEQPLSIIVVTPDNRIRRANLLGTSADGVAVLHLIGQLDVTPLPLAVSDPDPKAERALIGYTAAGKQAIQSVGTAEQPTALSTIMNAAKLGGPVVDKAGQVVGVVVGDTVPASTIIGVDKLREYVAPRSAGITARDGTCTQSRGPQSAIVPDLQVASTPLAAEAHRLLGNYLTLENQRDFTALQGLYSKQLKKTLTVARDSRSHQTSYLFGAKLTEVSPDGDGGAYARTTYNALFSPIASGADGQSCNRLDVRYRMVRQGGKLVIDQAKQMADPVSCDSE